MHFVAINPIEDCFLTQDGLLFISNSMSDFADSIKTELTNNYVINGKYIYFNGKLTYTIVEIPYSTYLSMHTDDRKGWKKPSEVRSLLSTLSVLRASHKNIDLT